MLKREGSRLVGSRGVEEIDAATYQLISRVMLAFFYTDAR